MDASKTGLPGPLRGLRSRSAAPRWALWVLLAALLGACGGEQAAEAPESASDAAATPVAAAPEPEAGADPFPDPPAEARPAPDLPEVRDLPRSYRELHAMLTSDEVLMEWKHEIVQDDLAPDPSSAATQVLMLATRNDSIPISMASLKALARRVDDPDVESHLIWLLDDPRWERRAWAARVLGQEGSDDVVPVLRARLVRESENRVRDQLEIAIESLRSHTAELRPEGGEAGG